MSDSRSIATRRSSVTMTAPLGESAQFRKAFFEVERGRDTVEIEAEPHHRNATVGLDAGDDRIGAPELRCVGDRPERPRREGVENIEGRYVDDHAATPMSPHLRGEVVPQLSEILVG